jgi:hypothetical protein
MSVRSTFRNLRTKVAASWLLEGEGGLVGYSLDLLKDTFVERTYLGLLARLPQNDPTGLTTAPADALEAIGRDRGITRGISETDSSYARRLLAWLDDHKKRGSPFELMHQLAGYVNDSTARFKTVDARGNWYMRAADGTETSDLDTGNWNWDGAIGTRWSRFWVIIYPGARWTSTDTWGAAGDWGDPTTRTWGTTATQEQVTSVRSIVKYWKPGGTVNPCVIIALDNASFDSAAPEPDGLWGRWSKIVDGVRVPSRLATARYWQEIS